MRPIQFFLIAFVLFALAKVIQKYTQRGMPLLHFLSWVLVWAAAAIIISFPDTTSFLAHVLGIGRGADLILYIGLLIAFYLIFRIHLTLDRLEQDITEVIRVIALERLSGPIDQGSGDRES